MATAPKAAGIMDLPENDDMNQAPQLSPMESYDAVTTALNIASPDAASQYEQTMNMSLPPELMEMSAEEISQILQLFQYLQENPEEYPAAIADLVEEGVIEAGDLPPEYDEEVLATVTALLMQALRTKQGSMPQQPQGFAMGGIADAARIVAKQGRGQDTMLAHITPEEAQLLRSRGGMGTINPMTGLREYGWFKKTFGFSSKKIPGVSAVNKIAKPLISVAKKIVSSPLGRIAATIGLTMVLGPMAGAFAAPLASGATTLLAGGDLKDALISGATAYFGAPGGPVASLVGKAGISSVAGQAAAASGLIGTAANLATGKSLRESIKSGLTQAAIGGGSAIVSNYMAQADGSKSLMDAVNQDAPVLTPEGVLEGERAPVENKNIPRQEGAPVTGSGEGIQPDFPPLTDAQWDAIDPNKVAAGPEVLPFGSPPAKVAAGPEVLPFGSPPGAAGPGLAPTNNVMDQFKDYGAALYGTGAPIAPAPTGGIGSLVQGAKDLYGGAKNLYNEYLSPSGIAAQGEEAAHLAGMAARNKLPANSPDWLQESTYNNAVEAARPGFISQYGPLAAAGAGATYLMGGFSPTEVPDDPRNEDLMYGDPARDLINADPSKYLVQNMRGIEYDSRGNIIGSNAPTRPVGNPYVPSTRQDDYQYNPYGGYNPQYVAQAPRLNYRGEQNRFFASGGIAQLSNGGYPRRTGQIEGPGTEKSDSIPAMLSDGEFVMTAGAVRGAGNGSRRAGAKKMYALMHQLEQNAARG